MDLFICSFVLVWVARTVPGKEPVRMGKERYYRMTAAFVLADARQPFTGRVVGHCSKGLLIHGAGLTGQAASPTHPKLTMCQPFTPCIAF